MARTVGALPAWVSRFHTLSASLTDGARDEEFGKLIRQIGQVFRIDSHLELRAAGQGRHNGDIAVFVDRPHAATVVSHSHRPRRLMIALSDRRIEDA